jgi:hypothetical protein
MEYNKEITVRHEKTDKGLDGNKLDQPTEAGFVLAFTRGLKERDTAYFGRKMELGHSKLQRTRDSAAAWGIGAGYMVVAEDGERLFGYNVAPKNVEMVAQRWLAHEETLHIMDDCGNKLLQYDPGMDSIEFDRGGPEYQELRNMKDKGEQRQIIFTKFSGAIKKAAQRQLGSIAERAYSDIGRATSRRSETGTTYRHNRTHGPLSDAVALLAIGQPLEVEAVHGEFGGFMGEGEGYETITRLDSGVYVVEFNVPQKEFSQTIPLETIAKRAGLR